MSRVNNQSTNHKKLKQQRIQFLVLSALTIVLGLMSRQINFIPLFIGDMLYAVMVFFMLSAIAVKNKVYQIAIMSMVITFAIEFSQLYQADWINAIRVTLPGRIVLGQGFLWSDLVAYTMGILLATMITWLLLKQSNLNK